MTWKSKLKQLKHQLESLFPSHDDDQPQFTTPIKKYWEPVFEPENLVNTDWWLKTGNGDDGWGNQELQHYSSDATNSFHTQNGCLVVRAVAYQRAHKAEDKFTSARLVSKTTLGRDRGVLTAVIQLPCAPGIWPAFWLLPQEPSVWPTDGEIDIAETWNGDGINRTCLHFGHHEEPDKHRVVATPLQAVMPRRPIRFDFAWDQTGDTQTGGKGNGRIMWYIDGRPVMKGHVPPETRPLGDFTILLNIAMGGNVCGGKVPADGSYDMSVHALYMADTLEFGGWGRFDEDHASDAVPIGNTY